MSPRKLISLQIWYALEPLPRHWHRRCDNPVFWCLSHHQQVPWMLCVRGKRFVGISVSLKIDLVFLREDGWEGISNMDNFFQSNVTQLFHPTVEGGTGCQLKEQPRGTKLTTTQPLSLRVGVAFLGMLLLQMVLFEQNNYQFLERIPFASTTILFHKGDQITLLGMCLSWVIGRSRKTVVY